MVNIDSLPSSSHAEAGHVPASFLATGPATLTVETVIHGRLRSDTDRARSDSTGRILTNPSYQLALASFAKTLAAAGASAGESRVVNGVRYHALFASSCQIEIEVKFLIGVRPRGQQPDLDNLWKPLQNALAIPPASLVVLPPDAGLLYTMFANDHQVTRYTVGMAPFIAASPVNDLTVVKVTAHPAPCLALARHS